MPSSRGSRTWRWASIALYASLVADLTLLLSGSGTRQMPPLVGMSFGLDGLIGAGCAFRAWRHPNLDR